MPGRQPKNTRPKSFKADGTPKKRWTAAQRKEHGRPSRRSSGRRAAERPEKLGWGVDGAIDRRDGDREGGRREGGRREGGRREGGRRENPRREERRPLATGRDGDRPSRRTPKHPTPKHPTPKHTKGRRDDRRPRVREQGPTAADVMEWSADTAEPSHRANPATATATTDTTFAQLGVPAALVAELATRGIEHPFPIQEATIPDALAGRDVLGRGRTGSGKTLGFGLPLVARLMADPDHPARRGRSARGLVLVPTRELALQVADVVAPLARAAGLEVVLVAGGMAYGPQIKAFASGVDIVVATPGRLIDLMKQDAADLTGVRITVLDEADHMADLGFLPDVTTLLDAVPADGQRLLFSATLDRGIDTLVATYLHDPLTHEVDAATASVTTMTHAVLHVLPHDKNATTAAIANREGRTVVFVRTQRGADRVAGQLRAAGVMAGALHGGLTQGARSRVLLAFREGSVPVLVATDVAARGIHVDDVSLVLQVDPPMGSKDYLHRAGRTARAGNAGVVATIVLPHQRKQTDRLLREAGVTARPMRTHPTDDALAEVTGARAPHADPIDDAAFHALIAPRAPERKPQRKPGFRRGGRPGRGHGAGHGARKPGAKTHGPGPTHHRGPRGGGFTKGGPRGGDDRR